MIHRSRAFLSTIAQQRAQEDISLVTLLKACSAEKDHFKGCQAHAVALKRGSLGENIFVGSAIVNMYAKCGALATSRRVFDELPVRNAVSWNALIMGYAQHGLGKEALSCFDEMKHEGVFPNMVTFLGFLKACGSIGAAEKGKEAHDEMVRAGLLDRSVVLGTALLDMYVKCGELVRAQEVFDELPLRNAISWTVLITGYCQHGHGHKALVCFDRMKRSGLSPDAVTFSCILKACGSIGATKKGAEIHEEILRNRMLAKDNVLCTALADMYVKCGQLSKAQQVFEKLPGLDVVAWNALIGGYCQHGHCLAAIECFDKMQQKGFSPDAATFASILKACGSTGAAEKGQTYFDTMSQTYGIVPCAEHHTSMADLFGRAGHFDKAITAITKMPSCEHFPLWIALLGACQKWGNVKFGGLAFEHVLQFENAAPFCMDGIYSTSNTHGGGAHSCSLYAL
ncbi:hypothetical protein GOP47_0029667 [Adiantum capillus-veneris]|nr:hypothetical protein GOP47_0029667 [Adiantum capillus-veneris]